jgi:hypothetical protein
MKKKKKPERFGLIYKGFSFEEAEKASKSFWINMPLAQKLEAVTQVIQDTYLLKGIDFHALRLLRTTAIIRKA